jgi:hypothetical protein
MANLKVKSKTTRAKDILKDGKNVVPQHEPFLGSVDRFAWIVASAYYKAEARGFSPGQEMNDWLEAEAEFVARHGG